ncbi:MAG: HEAT repeat domain-containing protein [Acidobacteriota bacterium]|nr:HEAT repeat domain-containing protein [Acidobacteriota bacterium]MDW3228728.1 HEAT repeat domain-containing protein [Acidobacteriota bacterium]MDY0232364.1 HEAT repeat domain-containing protein [Candidatus Saccharicenans sp.]
MIKQGFKLAFILIAIITLAGQVLISQEPGRTLEERIEFYYQKLNSPVFEERMEAVNFFHQLTKEQIHHQVIIRLIDLYNREQAAILKFWEMRVPKGKKLEEVAKELLYTQSESWGIYARQIYDIIARSGEPEGFEIAVKHAGSVYDLAAYLEVCPEKVVEAELKRLESNNPAERSQVCILLKDFIRPKERGFTALGGLREKIKSTLKEIALKDENRYARDSAVKALGESGDSDVIPILEKIATTDSYKVELEIPSEDPSQPPKKVIKYPVRETAKKELEKLKKGTHGP